jgi:hypothetical protein
MDLDLRGKALQSVLIEYTVRLQLSDGYFVVVESPYTLHVQGTSFSLSPEEEQDVARQAFNQLVGDTVEMATADAAGALDVTFAGGARLQVEADAEYEAWNVSGPDGALVVSTAGGELSVWKPQSATNDSSQPGSS